VLLLLNEVQEYNNPLASFATSLCRQRTRRANCAVALSVSGTSRSRLCPVGLASIYPALPICLVVYV